MASQASVASSQPDQRHLRLIAAAAQANESRLRDILAEDPPWSSATDNDALRQALQKVATRGKLSTVRLLLHHGADVNARKDRDVAPLFKACEGGHVAVVGELLQHGADPNWTNRLDQTALFAACIKGHDTIAQMLLDKGANIEATDKEGRTPLLYLASEKLARPRWTVNTVRLLLRSGANTEARDQLARTSLLWAATNGNVELSRALLDMGAHISATNQRGRTALHLAAESSQKDKREHMVRLLLERGADPRAVSDGGWTPLHNAVQTGHLPVASLLLEANVDVNCELSNGMTPLHWAAFNGFEAIVRLLLKRKDLNLTIKDSFGRTAMLCAAEKNHTEIVQLLCPSRNPDRLSPDAEKACRAFNATIVDFGEFEKQRLVSSPSVYDLLYGWDEQFDKPKISTLTKNIKYKPDFRWIHLPANNIAWVKTLIAKSFVEAGHRDTESYNAIEQSFEQEHRGKYTHAHFMRTHCKPILTKPKHSHGDRPLSPLSEEKSPQLHMPGQFSTDGTSSPTPKRPNGGTSDEGTPKSDSKKKSKSDQMAERHPKKSKRAKGPPGNPPSRQNSNSAPPSIKLGGPQAWESAKQATLYGKMVLFMPFLHYETDKRRREMSQAIKDANSGRHLPENSSKDSVLIHAYLEDPPRLHPRRTLDQFYYHGIDTSVRDTDQVVYRYCERNNVERKVFMVDQLWLWIIGKDLIITCFPQRWDQPKRDPLNVLDAIIEETNAKTQSQPMYTVYELAMLITSRCSGIFNRHRMHDQNYQFLDMFENSIGLITDRESRLFDRFNKASALSSQWLSRHRKRGRTKDKSLAGFPDSLLDVSDDTSCLAEIKDVRDELSIIRTILESQLMTLSTFEAYIIETLRSDESKTVERGSSNLSTASLGSTLSGSTAGGSGGRRSNTDVFVSEIRRRARWQNHEIQMRLKDVERMDLHAKNLYVSLTDLLDLKQKHSNALEARLAGDQAVIAAKQGQTIMVFTIVTILFLPMSFIAAFFAINFKEWEDDGGLTVPFVAKYTFGIGLGISTLLVAMAFAVADLSHLTKNVGRAFDQLWHQGTAKPGRRRHVATHQDAGIGASDSDSEDDFEKKMKKRMMESVPSQARSSLHDTAPPYLRRKVGRAAWQGEGDDDDGDDEAFTTSSRMGGGPSPSQDRRQRVTQHQQRGSEASNGRLSPPPSAPRRPRGVSFNSGSNGGAGVPGGGGGGGGGPWFRASFDRPWAREAVRDSDDLEKGGRNDEAISKMDL